MGVTTGLCGIESRGINVDLMYNIKVAFPCRRNICCKATLGVLCFVINFFSDEVDEIPNTGHSRFVFKHTRSIVKQPGEERGGSRTKFSDPVRGIYVSIPTYRNQSL